MTLFEHRPLNIFDSIVGILSQIEDPLEEYFWTEPQSVSLWNAYRTGATRNRGALQIDDPVFKIFWTKYCGLHIDCQDQEECFCEHNCGGTNRTIERALDPQSDSQATIKAQP